MMYCVDIRDYYSGNTERTIFETKNHDEAYVMANRWNKEHGVTKDDIEAFYNEDILMRADGTFCKQFADVFQDETR